MVPAGPHTNREGYKGPPREYDATVMQMGYRKIQDPVAFAEIENRFKTTKDFSGRSMYDVAKEYWDNKRKEGKI